HEDGTVDGEVQLPREGEGISRKGAAGPVACSAPDQCWMATERGWLFHLGGAPVQDTDPAMHALITQRPCDNSCPALPPVALPLDDSGSEFAKEEFLPPKGKRPRRPRARSLVAGIHRRMIHGTVLQLSFSLRARARVRLVAKRRRHV